jgi:cytochrome c556
MKRPTILFTVVLAGAAMVASGCASAQAQRQPAEYVADRQTLMKEHGDVWKNIQDSAKANNLPAVASGADKLAQNAKKIPALFPPGSMTDKSKAKPEIWKQWPEFEAAAKKLETESVKLRDTAKTGNAEATGGVMKDFGRNACGTCHTPFRVPPPKS